MDELHPWQSFHSADPAAHDLTSAPSFPSSVFIPVLPRMLPLPDAGESAPSYKFASARLPTPTDTRTNTDTPAPIGTATATATASNPPSQLVSTPRFDSGEQPAPEGRVAEKRPALTGLYRDTLAESTPQHTAADAPPALESTQAASTTASSSSPAAPPATVADVTDTPPVVPSLSRPSRGGSSALLSFHRQLTVPQLYGDEEAIRVRADIEAHYVHFLRCWQQRANPHIQDTTGAVAPLVDAHSKLQQTFSGQYAAAVRGDSMSAAATSQPSLAAGRDDGVLAAVDEVRKSVRKRRPPKLLAESDDDGQEDAQAAAAVKRQRQTKDEDEEATAVADGGGEEEKQPDLAPNGDRAASDRRAADMLDKDVVVVQESTHHSEHASNRPRRTGTATRKRDVLLSHHFFRHFSLRCYSISNPPQPPPSQSAAPRNSAHSVNYHLYAQSQAMLKAQFPKIGKADQPSTSYYACLCVEPLSTYYHYCASLLPPHVHVAGDDDAPIVLSSSLFDLCEDFYTFFRILFFTSPYTTNGFATLLLAHLRLLAARLQSRLIVCATRAQKAFWLSCQFKEAQHWGGLNFGDTVLMSCKLMDEAQEEQQRRRLAFKSEERLKVKLARFNSRGGARRAGEKQPLTGARGAGGETRADGGKRTGFHRNGVSGMQATTQQSQQRDKRHSSTNEHGLSGRQHGSAALSQPARSTVASASACPPSEAAPLQVYHPYIVRSLHSGRLLPIRGPPLAYRHNNSSPSPFVASAAVMCVTQQSAYHKGGTLLLTFILQLGTLLACEQRVGEDSFAHAAIDASTSATVASAAGASHNGSAQIAERVWRVRLVQGRPSKRGGGAAVDIAEQFLYPLGNDWRERYGLPAEQTDDAVKEDDSTAQQAPVKDEQEAEEEAEAAEAEAEAESSGSDSELDSSLARTRHVPELIDLADDSDRSANSTPDPLNSPPLSPGQQHQSQARGQHDAELLEDDDEAGSSLSLDTRSAHFDVDGDSKFLSTPTLHATADTDAPSSPLALLLPPLDGPPSSSPTTATSPSPSPSPSHPSARTPAAHAARLQLLLPMSPSQAHRTGRDVVASEPAAEDERATNGGLNGHASPALKSAVRGDEDGAEAGEVERSRMSPLPNSKLHSKVLAFAMEARVAGISPHSNASSNAPCESIFAMMS